MAEIATLFATSAAASAPTFASTALANSAVGASIAAGTAGSAGSIFTLANLGTGLSLASMAGDIFGGVSEGRAASEKLRQEAEQDFLNAKQDELQGLQQQNDISENLRQTIATQRLAFSGAGIDFSFGTPEKLERNLERQAELQLGTSRDNTRLKSLARRRAGYLALSQRSQAQRAPVLAGVASAGRTLAGRLS